MNTVPIVPGSARKVLSSRAWTPTSTPCNPTAFHTPLLRPVPAPSRPFHIDIGQEIYIERRDGKIHLASVKEIDHENNRVTVVFWETEQLRTKSVDMYRVLELNSWIPARPKASPIPNTSCNPTPNINANPTSNPSYSVPHSSSTASAQASHMFGSVKRTPQVPRSGTASSCENNQGKALIDPLRTPFKNLTNVQKNLNNQEKVKAENNPFVNSMRKSRLFSPPPPPRRPVSSCSNSGMGISNTPAPMQYYVSSSSIDSSSVLTFPLIHSHPILNHQEIELENHKVFSKNENNVETEAKTEIRRINIEKSPQLYSISPSSASSSSSPSFFHGRGEQTSAWTNTNFSTTSPSMWPIQSVPISKSKISNTPPPVQEEKALIEKIEIDNTKSNNNVNEGNCSTIDANSKKAEERKNRLENMIPVDREGYDSRPIRARYYEAGEKYEVAILEEMLQEEIQFCRDMTKTLVRTIQKLEDQVKEKEDIILGLEGKLKALELKQSQSYFKNQNRENIHSQSFDKSPANVNDLYYNIDEQEGSSPEFLDASCFFQD